MNIFDGVFVINLETARGRYARVNTRCKHLGLRCERINAVNGKRLTDAELSAVATPECAGKCTPAMLGCALSHMKVWNLARQRGLKRVLVLEDDAAFTDSFWDVITAGLTEVPKDFDILLLGCTNLCEPTDSSSPSFVQWFMRHYVPKENINSKHFRSQHVFTPEFFGGTHAYVVSQRGLQKLCDSVQRVHDHIDWQLAAMHKVLNIYAVTPHVAYQESMMESSTASYGFPGTLNTLLSKYRDRFNVEYSYYLNVGYRRVGSLRYHIQLNAWHTLLFYAGLLGLPWKLFMGFALADIIMVTPSSPTDVAAKCAAYALGLAVHHIIRSKLKS